MVELARWGLGRARERRVRLPEPVPTAAPRWIGSESLEAALALVREAFNRGERIAVEVPIWVKPAGRGAEPASCDVYLERDDQLSAGEEHFVRDGITVAGVRSAIPAGVRSIVCVRGRALSTLLGDAENPAHTEWQERSPRFRESYRHGPFTLRYVKGAPREIVRILTRPSEGRDLHLLRHLFSVDIPTEEQAMEKEHTQERRPGPDGAVTNGTVEAAAGTDRFFQLQKLHDGFCLAGVGNARAMPRHAAVWVAYEVRRGNPFVLYQPPDFELNRPPIKLRAQGEDAAP